MNIHDLAPAYSLDALDDHDRLEFETHLRSCHDCQRQVRAMADVTEELAWEHGDMPSDRVREAVTAALDSTPQVGPDKPTSVSPLVRRRRWIPATIAAVIAILSLLGWSLLSSGRMQAAILADPNAISIQAASTEQGQGVFNSAELIFSPEREAGVLIIEGLEPVGEDRTYELWLIDETGPVAAGVFRPGPDGGATVLIDGEMQPGALIALTEEPAGGLAEPSGEVLLTAEITA